MPDDLGLPEPFTLRGFAGSFGEYIEHLWWMYRALEGLRVFDRQVVAAGAPTADGRDARFWHLVTSSSRDGRRLDLKRCANLPRVWDMLERLQAGDPRIVWWYERHAIHVAPVDFSGVVVLEERGHALLLRTAFPVDRPQSRRRWYARASAAWEAWATGRHRVPDTRHPLWRRYSGGRRPGARQVIVAGHRS